MTEMFVIAHWIAGAIVAFVIGSVLRMGFESDEHYEKRRKK